MISNIVTDIKSVLEKLKDFNNVIASKNEVSFEYIDGYRYKVGVSDETNDKGDSVVQSGAHTYTQRRRYITAIQYNGHNFDEVSKLYCGCHIVEYFDGRTSPELILTDDDINKFIAVCGVKCYVIPMDVFYKEYEIVEY